MQITILSQKKSIEIALKYTKLTKSKKHPKRIKNLSSQWNQN